MTLIQHLMRAAVPALAMAAMFAAAPASAADADTRALINFRSCEKPMYPEAALKEKRTGAVAVGFLVNTEGTVDESKVNSSSGHTDLDETARNALKLCKFSPAIKDGKPVTEWVQVKYVWVLK
ncbi:MAG: energy transducer TonB [Pseudomonadota bacterium]